MQKAIHITVICLWCLSTLMPAYGQQNSDNESGKTSETKPKDQTTTSSSYAKGNNNTDPIRKDDSERIRSDLQQLKPVQPDSPSWAQKWEMEAGLHFSPIIPMGELGKFLNTGYGASLFGSLDFPYLSYTNVGLAIGVGQMQSKISYFQARVTMIPLMLYAESYTILWRDFRPYLRLGIGGTAALYSGQSFSSESATSFFSFDPSIDVGAGLGYRAPFWPKIEFLLYSNYFTALENNGNSFFMFSIGTNYIF